VSWIVMPFLNCWDLTQAALADCLAQTGLPAPPQVLAVDTGSRDSVREAIDDWAIREPRLHVWHWRPSLPSLSAVWNWALEFVWAQVGEEDALVVNNDVRLHPCTYSALRSHREDALFITAVGRREADMDWAEYFASEPVWQATRGGPDFSCFLIRSGCHWLYPFDEAFIPAYCEDNDYHRRLLLDELGGRIFSVNLPYLHYGAATINQETDERKLADWARRIETARTHYRSKWGGDVNAERYRVPFDPASAEDGITNPELQRAAGAS
jgi:hypothetical protein